MTDQILCLSDHPIELARLVERVAAPDRGGIATFLGLVRNHQNGRRVLRLEYSAYRPMAEAECERILDEAEQRWPVRIALAHRVGVLEVGDAAVGVAAAGAHRDEAFAACRYVIEELKRRVPIWKKEFYQGGAPEWVGPVAGEGSVPASVTVESDG